MNDTDHCECGKDKPPDAPLCQTCGLTLQLEATARRLDKAAAMVDVQRASMALADPYRTTPAQLIAAERMLRKLQAAVKGETIPGESKETPQSATTEGGGGEWRT